MKKQTYKDWTLIKWDGNPTLNYQCYRKSFGKGHVSIGVGSFDSIVYSYGPNSEDSISSTRWRKNGSITEQEAMQMVDNNNGRFKP